MKIPRAIAYLNIPQNITPTLLSLSLSLSLSLYPLVPHSPLSSTSIPPFLSLIIVSISLVVYTSFYISIPPLYISLYPPLPLILSLPPLYVSLSAYLYLIITHSTPPMFLPLAPLTICLYPSSLSFSLPALLPLYLYPFSLSFSLPLSHSKTLSFPPHPSLTPLVPLSLLYLSYIYPSLLHLSLSPTFM
jgi:hypothetical protein